MQKINIRPIWLKNIQRMFIAAIIISYALVIKQLWPDIQNIDWRFDSLYLILSIVIVIFAMLGWSAIWSWLFNRLSSSPSTLEQGISIYLYGNLTKYLPGSFWNYISRGYLGYKLGFHPEIIWLASLIEIGVSISSGLLIYSLSLIFPHQNHPFLPQIIILLGFFIMLGMISPPVLKYLLAWLKSKSRWINNFHINIEISWIDYLIYVGFSTVTWIFVGLAFCFFVISIYPLPIEYYPETIGVWSLSISFGLLVILVPQGIGIREGLLIFLLKEIVPLPVTLSIAGISRFWIIFCEVLATFIWWITSNVRNKILPKNY